MSMHGLWCRCTQCQTARDAVSENAGYIHDQWCHCPKCDSKPAEVTARGFVYLLKAGPYYKIGRTTDFDRRFDQIRLQVPFSVEIMHKIETEDPEGIEAYWHRRFDEKRKNGEWFELSEMDVAAFKWREKM